MAIIYEKIWRDALVPGCSKETFADGLYCELAEYVNKPVPLIKEWGEHSQERLNSEWKPEYDVDSRGYYQNNTTYLYNLVHWHANYGEAKARVSLMLHLKSMGKTSVLDFGSGVGSTALLFASNGFNISVADIAEPLLSYMSWRMNRRGFDCRIYNLNKDSLPIDAFDAISAIDVFEHVNDPKATLQNIYNSLHEGGLICFNVCGGEGAPMHVTETEEVLCHMRLIGFTMIKNHDVPLFIYKKGTPSIVGGALWYLYYRNRLVLRHAMEKIGIYQSVRRFIKSWTSPSFVDT